MIIDIAEHLRRLVLVGFPLLGASCDAVPGEPTPGSALANVCQTKVIMTQQPPLPGGQTAAVGFELGDPWVGDLYEACVNDGKYCRRLCQEVLGLAPIPVPQGLVRSGPFQCQLSCDDQGKPVATLSFAFHAPPVPGRRPEGFLGGCPTGPGTTLTTYLSACAILEGASIAAFSRLAAELEHHGAPTALIGRARRAARDEARHFRVTAGLARRFGAPHVSSPQLRSGPPRTLAALALENASEGCVNETVAAAIALWQTARAGEPEIRSALAGIAEDELSHAQLSWDIHAWAGHRLGPGAARELERARAEAALGLLFSCQRPVDRELVARAGLPDAAATSWLAAHAQPS